MIIFGICSSINGIGKENPMNAYMDRFLNLDKMCFTEVNKKDINYINWYNHHNDKVFPISEFCAHDTLLRNLIYNECDIREGGFRNRLIRNENQILNWKHCNINGIEVQPVKMTNGVVLTGDNSPFDVEKFNNMLNSIM